MELQVAKPETEIKQNLCGSGLRGINFLQKCCSPLPGRKTNVDFKIYLENAGSKMLYRLLYLYSFSVRQNLG